jgi:hypothetical protein
MLRHRAAWAAAFILLAGCGKTGGGDLQAKAGDAESTTAAVEETTGVLDATRYRTEHDPDKTYTLDDIAMRGSYLKLDFTDVQPAVMDRVVHRLRSEHCTCGCEKDTIDECLINDPNCETAVTLANQVIREERVKG